MIFSIYFCPLFGHNWAPLAVFYPLTKLESEAEYLCFYSNHSNVLHHRLRLNIHCRFRQEKPKFQKFSILEIIGHHSSTHNFLRVSQIQDGFCARSCAWKLRLDVLPFAHHRPSVLRCPRRLPEPLGTERQARRRTSFSTDDTSLYSRETGASCIAF